VPLFSLSWIQNTFVNQPTLSPIHLINMQPNSSTLHSKLHQLSIYSPFLQTLLSFLAFVQLNSIQSLKMAKRNVAANSPLERTSLAYLDQRLAMAKHCSHGNAYFTINV
jgi:hypothetical protein